MFCGLGLGMITSTQFNLPAAERIISLSAGSADGDTIQSALNALPATGGEVFLGPGTYVVRRPIILQRDSLTLRGSGPETVLYLKDKANCPVVILGAPDRGAKATTKLRLSDLYIDGNRDHQDVELWRAGKDGSLINNNGVDIRHVTDSVYDATTARQCTASGFDAGVCTRVNAGQGIPSANGTYALQSYTASLALTIDFWGK